MTHASGRVGQALTLFGVLVLVLKVDEETSSRTSKVHPLVELFRFGWWRITVAVCLFCLAMMSFGLYQGWIA